MIPTRLNLHPLLLTAILAVAFIAGACSNRSGSADNGTPFEGRELTEHASLLSLIEVSPTLTIAELRNPWDSLAAPRRLALVERGSDAAEQIAGRTDVEVVTVPLQSSVVYSSVHAGAIEELGRLEAIKGVADAPYFKMPAIAQGIASGKVMDIGMSTSPSQEKILALNPDAILNSPFKNSGQGVVATLGIPVIEMADYMESTPLGRAEWIKLLGKLYGNYAAADSIFNQSTQEYERLRALAADAQSRPVVLTEQLTDGVWFVPGGASYMAAIFADAGASYPWASDTSGGSLQLDIAAVVSTAGDADYWFIRTFGYDVTLNGLKRDHPLNARIRAWADGNVYGCNTAESMFFEEFPFHPERLLREFIVILHPEVLPGEQPRYYRKAQQG